MRISIIGLPQCGKTTFFNLLTQRGVSGSLSGKKSGQIATAFVPDERIDRLSEVYKPKKTTYASIEFLDTPGLSTEGDGKGFSSGGLDDARRADTFCLVIREFGDEGVSHPLGNVDGVRDLNFILNEFLLNDYMVLDKRAEKLRKSVQLTKKMDEKRHLEVIENCLGILEKEVPLREAELTEADLAALVGYQLLTLKPILVVLNVDEDRIGELEEIIAGYAEKFPKLSFTALSASTEADLAQMDPDEAKEFMADLGIEQSASNRVIKAAFGLLGLQVFLTAGPDEVRSWPMPKNGTCLEAAGAIHSDFQRTFIRAVTLPYAKFEANPSPDTFKRESEQRRKEDLVQDGDIIEFRVG